ncbi:MAG: hypothetical protein MZU97_10215 [Bacillus subtilis]|nr:hypothetical protein [Bacillus subtilis]
MKKAYNPIGMNVVVNTEKPLQTVFHFHIHLIPRYPNDGVDIDFINNAGNTPRRGVRRNGRPDPRQPRKEKS